MLKSKLMFKRILTILLCIVCALSVTSCKKDDPNNEGGGGNGGGETPNTPITPTEVIDNETTPLRIATLDLDGVFSPFYSTSATDGSIVGMTQIGMLSSTPDGQIAYGDKEAVVTKDYAYKYLDENGDETEEGSIDGSTIYQFVIKKDIKFSDGTPLTMHDVLFSLYLLLDPAYTGSSTIYSTDIQGLYAYRQQDPDATEDSNDGFEQTFEVLATQRVNNLVKYVSSAYERENFTAEEVAEIKSDIDQLSTYFSAELNTDFATCSDGIEDYQKQYVFDEAWEMFLFYEGIVSLQVNATGKYVKDSEGRYIIESDYLKEEFAAVSDKKQYAINLVYDYYMGDGSQSNKINYENKYIASVAQGFVSATELYTYLVAEEKAKYFADIKATGSLAVKSVEGIKVLQGSDFFGDASYTDDYEILQITINGVDPKAIWNFGFTVAPMHYYSDAEHTEAAMADTKYEEDFGVEFGDTTWYTNTVRSKNNAPMGAGPYKMSTAEGIEGKTPSQIVSGFYKDNMVYFERNDSFLLGKPVIKYIRYKVINANSIMDSLISGDIDYADPSATEYNISQVTANSSFLSQTLVRTNGYGYIGVNPKYVENINIRKAIMYAMDLSYIKDYYPGNLSQEIYRPMSLVSWVYNYNADGGNKWTPDPFYQSDFDNYDETVENINYYVEQAGYQWDLDENKWYIMDGTDKVYLKYTFTIAGDSEDHPAYRTMEEAAKLLNDNGWDITLKTDPDALKKLSSGTLAVWAAAWGSAIDPDMYQVYHIDSTASSTKNWGYDVIQNDDVLYETELELIEQLSELIDAARETLDEKERALIYQEALDLVMELAVELPIYQRNDMYVYNTTRIDVSTLIQSSECTPYYGPLAEIWNVSLKETGNN